jgi:hypothetical protein
LFFFFSKNRFILGVVGRPLTLAKAKRDNIKHQRLPLERYLKYD